MKFLLLTGLVLAAATARAELITFDDLPSGTTLGNQYAGATFTPGIGGLTVPTLPPFMVAPGPWATNTDMTVGPSTDASIREPLSGNVVRTVMGHIAENGDPAFTITFAQPIASMSLDLGGFRVGGNYYGKLYAFRGDSSTHFAEASATLGSHWGQTLSLSNLSGATKIVVVPGHRDDHVSFDNLRYTTSVPEPASLAVLGLGGLALLKRRRKSRR